MKACQHCNEPNQEGRFNCPSCGLRAHPAKWSTQFVLRDSPMATAIRKDQIDFGTKDMNQHIKETKKKNDVERDKKINSLIKWK
jgi:RNA polymerase subunit RPABC4/transcription elongation factor Spt4